MGVVRRWPNIVIAFNMCLSNNLFNSQLSYILEMQKKVTINNAMRVYILQFEDKLQHLLIFQVSKITANLLFALRCDCGAVRAKL